MCSKESECRIDTVDGLPRAASQRSCLTFATPPLARSLMHRATHVGITRIISFGTAVRLGARNVKRRGKDRRHLLVCGPVGRTTLHSALEHLADAYSWCRREVILGDSRSSHDAEADLVSGGEEA